MPLKQDVIPLLERTDPLSAKIGAVNTIFRAQDGKFYGFNTDVAGIIAPLERRMALAGAKVLVLGAGGAGRAAVFGLRDKGADVWILNRTPETATKLARQAGAHTIKREAVAKAGFDIIINATPVGMAGNKSVPLLHPDDLTCRLVFDLVYNPLETPLLRAARQKGISVITGVEMFVQQGARQFEIWTGKPAPEEEMLRVVLHSLRQAAEAAGEAPAPPPTVTKIERPKPAEPEAPPPAPAPPAKPAAPAHPVATAPKPAAKAPAKPAPKPAAKPEAKAAGKAAKPAAKAVKAAPKPVQKTAAKAAPKPAAKKAPAKAAAKKTAAKAKPKKR
jgi:3-dehydroquinate dehydratase/shikimate dehydrogenase